MAEISFGDIEQLTPPSSSGEISFEDITPAKPPEAPKQEESKPFTYFVGGIGKTATLLPALLGTIGSAGEAAYEQFTGDEDITMKSAKDAFLKASEEGTDADMTKYGLDLTKRMTDALGISFIPKRTGNQLFDLAGSFAVPIPGGMLPSLAGKGIVNKLGRAATFLSPAVRVTQRSKSPKFDKLTGTVGRFGFEKGLRGIDKKATGIRLGASMGIGTGIEQGIRALIDDPKELPLLFSDVALGNIPQQIPEIAFEDIVPVEIAKEDIEDGIQPNFVAEDYYDPAKAEANRLQEEAEYAENIKFWAIVFGGLLTGGVALKYRKSVVRARTPKQPFGTEPTVPQTPLKDAAKIVKDTPMGGFLGIGKKVKKATELAGNRLRISFGRQVDSDVLIQQHARAQGVPEHIIDQLRGQGNVDSVGQLTLYLQHGIAPNGQKVAVSLRDMKQTYDRWELPRQEQFLQYIAAIGEDIVRTKATARSVLENIGADPATFEKLNRSQKKAFMRIRDAYRGFSVQKIYDDMGNFVDEVVTPLNLGNLERVMDQYADFVIAARKTDKRVEVGMWKADGKPTPDVELLPAIKAGNADDEFNTMRKYLSEYNNIILQDSAKRGVQSQEWVDATIRSFSRGGEILYIPRQQAVDTPGFFKRQAMSMGLATTHGKTMNTVGNLQKQALGELEGVNSPMSPWHTTANYSGEMLEHTNRSVTQMNWMKQILGMEHDAGTGFLKLGKDGWPIFKKVDEALTAFRDKMFFTKTPTYIGRISPKDPDNMFNSLNLKFHTDAEGGITHQKIAALKKGLGSEDPGTSQMAMQELGLISDALVIQHRGEFHIFGNMDKNFKMAMEFDTGLIDNIAKFNNYFKRIMTAGTTGRYSTFSPISFIYNASIGSINAALKAKGGFMEAGAEAIRVWRDGIKGAVDVMATGIADDFAQLIAHTLETGTGIGSSNPALLAKLQKKLAARSKRSFVRDFRQKTGGIGAGGQGTTEFKGTVSGAMESSAGYISKVYGGNVFPEFVRIWDHINAGFHEGTSYGVALRKLGGTTKGMSANQIRIAKRQAADLVGNNQLQGASYMARQLNAAIPFYGAALQGITTLGRAVKQAGTFKTVSRLTAAIGTPVFIEMTYNSWLDGDKKYRDAAGREWTQNEYYYHGFTAGQRANNIIVGKPGRPMWEALIIPVIPELAAIRGFYMDAIELVMGLSDIAGISNTGTTKEAAFSFDHLSASAARAGNVPLPPLWKGLLSLIGVDARVGLSTEGADGELSIAQIRTLPQPNRQTPNLEQARYEGGEVSVRLQAFVQDIGGALATIGLKSLEGFMSGDESTPASERLRAGIDSLGIAVKGTAKLPSAFLPGRTLPTAPGDPEISSQVFAKEKALKHWVTVQETQLSGGTFSGGSPKQGRTSKITQDPITQALAATANTYLQMGQYYKENITELNKLINSLQHSLVNSFNDPTSSIPQGPISVAQRNELISSYKALIGVNKRVWLGVLKQSEEEFALRMGDTVGEPLSGFTFDGWKDRANPN